MMQRTRNVALSLAALVALTTAACGGKERAESESSDTAQAPPPAASTAGAPATPAPGGKVIVVDAVTDGSGNYFQPKDVTARKGDVIRFTLKSGVHNVHFLPDSNPGKSGLPPASQMLQLPGQTVDVPVTFDDGTYYFQCDPHAALGMQGHLTVKEE